MNEMMKRPVAAYKRNGSIALVFSSGIANEFMPRKGTDATMSRVCSPWGTRGWVEIPVSDAIRAAEACGWGFEDDAEVVGRKYDPGDKLDFVDYLNLNYPSSLR